MPVIRNNRPRFAAAVTLAAPVSLAALVALVAPMALLVPWLTACGAPAPRAVIVTTQSFRFQPAAFEWQSGQPLRLALRNPDAVEHDFVVDGLRTSAAAGRSVHTHPTSGPTPSPTSLHIHAGPYSETSITFTPLTTGSFTVYCSIPGHKELGMVATLVVR
jgi:uncharacterized cupredoxin-like copper-binding protein